MQKSVGNLGLLDSWHFFRSVSDSLGEDTFHSIEPFYSKGTLNKSIKVEQKYQEITFSDTTLRKGD